MYSQRVATSWPLTETLPGTNFRLDTCHRKTKPLRVRISFYRQDRTGRVAFISPDNRLVFGTSFHDISPCGRHAMLAVR
ncbi:hypothetical protein DPMN_114178 [Dreissena polymorpha]|uniref:Uncharacterized protein n=1 Tax=Dreissena polymorpha TaxID=45954 RepID=A0A9D4QS78_DREPO|nr:hypothetical protein DPMN_114178 [Dreissena polymorpha]